MNSMKTYQHSIGTWLALGLGITCLSATTSRADLIAVQSMTDLDRVKAAARQENSLILLFFPASAGCHDCEVMMNNFIRNQSFTAWTDRHAELGIVDIAAGGTGFQDGRAVMSVGNPE